MEHYWDSFDCQVQCEEVYTEEPCLTEEPITAPGNGAENDPVQTGF